MVNMTEINRELNQTFIHAFNILARQVHENAREKGFWDQPRNNGEMVALMHEELSEALSYLRKDPEKADSHCPEYRGVEVELADVIIRLMDMAHSRGYDVAEALVSKMAYNQGREFKHGKKF